MSDEDLTTFADVERETNNQILIDIGTHYTPPPVVNRYSLRLEKENIFILMFKPSADMSSVAAVGMAKRIGWGPI